MRSLTFSELTYIEQELCRPKDSQSEQLNLRHSVITLTWLHYLSYYSASTTTNDPLINVGNKLKRQKHHLQRLHLLFSIVCFSGLLLSAYIICCHLHISSLCHLHCHPHVSLIVVCSFICHVHVSPAVICITHLLLSVSLNCCHLLLLSAVI